MTWRFHATGYEVFFNRDERRERKPALPPAVRRRGATRFVAPLDGDFGGTWIAVNSHGMTCCLLNGFPPAGVVVAERQDYISRGMVPLALAGCMTTAAAAQAVRELALDSYRPFVAVVLGPNHQGLTANWSGLSLELRMEPPVDQPLVSSSFYSSEVRSNRTAVFERMMREVGGDRGEAHLRYHRRHEPEAGPHSPCMHRADAETVSFSHIEVGATEIRFHYVPDSPCRGRPLPTTTMARAG
jgi:hypothetical protein